ncbi:MAG TPA: glycosyltransferase family 1 protein [Acidimicrobiales bacterium]|nr:glycosyltransferase family 1 protein [Acidimicrobiales bacterium]
MPERGDTGDRAARSGSSIAVAVEATAMLGVRSGVGRFCEGALSALGARGDVEVSAFAISWRRRRRLPAFLPVGVRAHQRAMPARPLHLAWRYTGFPPCEWFIGRTSVVHGTNFVVPPTKSAARVVTVHDLTTVRFPELCDHATLVYPQLVRKAVREGAWVHTPSRFVAEEVISEFGANPDRVRVVYHGARSASTPTSFERDVRRSNFKVDLPDGCERYLLSIGTVEPRKDYPGLVRAFDKLAEEHPDLCLVIAGADGWGTRAFDAAIEQSPFRSRILRLLYPPDEVLEAVLSGAQALVFPSLYEGFGFPPLEAMSAGVPVVATIAGAVPEIVRDAALLVQPGDPEALAHAIDTLLRDRSVVNRLVELGKTRAADFTWQETAAGLVRLYADAKFDR